MGAPLIVKRMGITKEGNASCIKGEGGAGLKYGNQSSGLMSNFIFWELREMTDVCDLNT